MGNVAKRGLRTRLAIAAMAVSLSAPVAAHAETLKVLTAGAFRQVLLAALPQFKSQGHDITWEADTVGGLAKRIAAGESFDVVFASPAALAAAHGAGKVGDVVDIARVGVGVAVKQGAPKPDLSTVDAFKAALQHARAVAYIDPASGGTSGIYLNGLIDRLGIGDAVRSKSILVKGGFSAERVAGGEADLAIQQISELLPVKGVVLAGPLPPAIQSYTVYSGAAAAATPHKAAADALLTLLRSPEIAKVITTAGMEPLAQKPSTH